MEKNLSQERLYNINTSSNTKENAVTIIKSRQEAQDFGKNIGFAPLESSKNSKEPKDNLGPNRGKPEPIVGPVTFINATLWQHALGHYHISFIFNRAYGDRSDQQTGNMSAKGGRFRDFARNVIKTDSWYEQTKENMSGVKDYLSLQLGAELDTCRVNRIMIPYAQGPGGRNVYEHTGVLLATTVGGDAMCKLYVNDQTWDIMFNDTPTEKQIAKGAIGSWSYRGLQVEEDNA